MHYDSFVRKALPAYDLNWRKYRRRQSRRGVHERMNELGLPAYKDYLAYLQAHPEEAEALMERMRVTVTRFFRDRHCWDELAKTILPRLAGGASGGVLRALSVGFAGGEEPYSLALLWKERVQPVHPGLRLDITALDVDETGLARAKAGRYPPGALKEMDRGMREKWFEPDGAELVLDPEIRGMVEFLILDAVNDDLPGNYDLVLCRYLIFTYFTGERMRQATQRLRQALKPGGALMTGAKEDVPPGLKDIFSSWPSAPACFHRRI